MLYRHFERRHGLTHELSSRPTRVIRILTWVRTAYIFISAVALAFALVKSEAVLAMAALLFLSASFALKRVSDRMREVENEWNET